MNKTAAQEATECNEGYLRNLGVAIINCTGDSAGASCDGASQLAGNDNTEKVWNFLISKGMTAVQAAGAMGNLQHEGNFNPKVVERGHMEGNRWVNRAPFQFPSEMETIPPHNLAPIASGRYAGQPGYGIIQWTSPGRKDGLQKMANDKNQPVHDLALQLDYMWSELDGPYKARALDPLMQTDDLETAVRIWQDHYEVGRGFQPRFNAAQDWLARYGSGTTTTGSTGGCQLDASGCPSGVIGQSETVLAAGIRVHPCIAAEVERIVTLANEQGLNMAGGGYRDKSGQIETRKNNCGTSQYAIYEMPAGKCSPPTARPGTSRHERGTAVDFTCDGGIFSQRSHPCFIFLQENTKLKNLPSEAWHWSIDGK